MPIRDEAQRILREALSSFVFRGRCPICNSKFSVEIPATVAQFTNNIMPVAFHDVACGVCEQPDATFTLVKA